MTELTAAPASTSAARRRGRAIARGTGTLLMVVGALLLVWGFWTWQWGDPVTRLYASWEQHRLEEQHSKQLASFGNVWQGLHLERPKPVATRPEPVPIAPPKLLKRLQAEATAYRASLSSGDAVARLRIPRLGLNAIVVEGTDAADLRRGPGRDERTFMPGEGELSYVAGHRTTFGAPFAHIDRMRRGDLATVEMPYATLTYRVTGSRIVPATQLSVLETRGRDEIALQACHPRFFAKERYIVYASLASIRLPDDAGGTTYRVAPAKSA
jgi:sortase A